MNGTMILKKPDASTPFWPSAKDCAPNVRWITYWFVHQ